MIYYEKDIPYWSVIIIHACFPHVVDNIGMLRRFYKILLPENEIFNAFRITYYITCNKYQQKFRFKINLFHKKMREINHPIFLMLYRVVKEKG